MRKTGIELKCKVCGKLFLVEPSRADVAKYCSRECMGIASRKKVKTICCYCKKEIEITLNKLRNKNYCCRDCRMKDYSGRNKSGCGITTDGYVWIYVNGYNKINQVKIHRYLMEIKLGRKLLPTEIVHHKDFNKLNNSIDNLEIVTRIEHNKIHNCFKK